MPPARYGRDPQGLVEFNEDPRRRAQPPRMPREKLRLGPEGGLRRQPKRPLGVVLFVAGCLIHFIGLSHPRQVVFDEVHFGKFLTAYCCTGERFFDVHPPHGKLLLAASARAAGYEGGFPFQRIGQEYGERVSPWALRWFPALLGALIPVLFFGLLRQLGASRAVAFLGGFALLLENALMVQTRMLSLDGILVASALGSLLLFLIALRRDTYRRKLWLAGAGALAGLATGTKWSGLCVLGLMAVVLFRPWLERRSRTNLWFAVRHLAVVAGAALVVYGAGWVAHLELLPKPGPGDAFYRMQGGWITDTVGLHRRMLLANATLNKAHPASSTWWQWPFAYRPIYYWSGPDRALWLAPNPVVWLGSTIGFLLVLGIGGLTRVTSLRVISGRHRNLGWIPTLGFFLSYLPFAFVTRPLFLYHYFLPMIFALGSFLLWMDHAEWSSSSRLTRQPRSYYAAAAAIVAGYLWLLPVTYALEAGPRYRSALGAFLRFFQ